MRLQPVTEADALMGVQGLTLRGGSPLTCSIGGIGPGLVYNELKMDDATWCAPSRRNSSLVFSPVLLNIDFSF